MSMNEKENFYAECAAIMNIDYTFVEPKPYRRRWGQRTPGNGRFPGRGTIRYYGPRHIHVSLVNPFLITKTFHSQTDVFSFLRNLKE